MNSTNVKSVKVEITVEYPASANVDARRIAQALFGTGSIRRSGKSTWTARVFGWTKDGEQFIDEATGV